MRAKLVKENLYMSLSDHDKNLIEKAEHTHYIDWNDVFKMAEMAESEEAAKILRTIAKGYYHREEGLNI